MLEVIVRGIDHTGKTIVTYHVTAPFFQHQDIQRAISKVLEQSMIEEAARAKYRIVRMTVDVAIPDGKREENVLKACRTCSVCSTAIGMGLEPPAYLCIVANPVR